MVTRLKSIDQKAVENHVNGAVWAFDYDKMFCVLMENEISPLNFHHLPRCVIGCY